MHKQLDDLRGVSTDARRGADDAIREAEHAAQEAVRKGDAASEAVKSKEAVVKTAASFTTHGYSKAPSGVQACGGLGVDIPTQESTKYVKDNTRTRHTNTTRRTRALDVWKMLGSQLGVIGVHST